MAKVVKLKIEDVQKIVNNVIRESEFDDFDTQIQPEELPDYKNSEEMLDPEIQKQLRSELGNYSTKVSDPSDQGILLGKDPKTGEIYVFKAGTGQILGKK